jgi:ABC-type multidrug transport system fused ATPase/permease subunit
MGLNTPSQTTELKGSVAPVFERVRGLRQFLGARTANLFLAALLIGLCWFAVEASFVYIMQIFLVAIGLVDRGKTILPEFLLVNQEMAALSLILFGVFRSSVHFAKIYVSGVTNQSFVRFQRANILTRCLGDSASLSSHELSSVFSETITHAGIFLMKASEFTVSATSFCFFFLMGMYLAPFELGISITILIVLVIPLKVFDRQIHEAGQGLQSEYASVSRTLLLTLKNRFFLDIIGETSSYVESGKVSLSKYEKHYKDFYRIYGLKQVAPNLLGVIILSGVTLLSLRWFHTEPIKLIGFFYVFIRLSQAASEANSTLSDFRLHKHSFKLLRELNEKLTSTRKTQLSSRRVPSDCSKIEFDGVSFSYDDGKSVLRDLSFTVRKNDRLLLKGPSGSGKSTTILLLCGLLEPTRGRVRVDGGSSNELDLTGLISYAGPEPFLIDGTVRSNLLFGVRKTAVTDAEMIEACRQAEIWDLISTLPGQLDFKLNEQAQLSTGQRQRLAIARSILSDGKIMIFDEATSNVDFENERKLIRNLVPFFKDRIVVFITHRDTLREFVNKEIDLSSAKEGNGT